MGATKVAVVRMMVLSRSCNHDRANWLAGVSKPSLLFEWDSRVMGFWTRVSESGGRGASQSFPKVGGD